MQQGAGLEWQNENKNKNISKGENTIFEEGFKLCSREKKEVNDTTKFSYENQDK